MLLLRMSFIVTLSYRNSSVIDMWYADSQSRYGETGFIGDRGEQIVEDYLKAKNYNYRRATSSYDQVKRKIDFYVEDFTIDVKTNVKNSSFYVELEKNYTPKSGWIYLTSAKEIWHVDLAKKSIFKYNTEDMRSYINESKFYCFITDTGAKLARLSTSLDFINKVV